MRSTAAYPLSYIRKALERERSHGLGLGFGGDGASRKPFWMKKFEEFGWLDKRTVDEGDGVARGGAERKESRAKMMGSCDQERKQNG